MRKSVKRALGVGILGGVAYAAWRAWSAGAPERPKGVEWSTAPWGRCPPTHPIKAKLGSGIYHAPGGANYARTKPDRCYVDETAAEADGLRPSKV